MKLFPIVKKIVAAGAHFKAAVDVAIKQGSVLSMSSPPQQTAGVGVAEAPATLLSNQRPAFSVSTTNSGTAANVANTPAPSFSTANSGTSAKPVALPAGKITQISYTLTHERGATAWTELNTTNGGWTDEANTLGDSDGVLAAADGRTLGIVAGELILSFDDLTDKSSLTIDRVAMRFYVQQGGTAANNGELALRVADGATNTVGGGVTFTGDVDYLTTPYEIDVTANVATWAALNDLQASVRFRASSGETYWARCDAVHLVVEASLTEAV